MAIRDLIPWSRQESRLPIDTERSAGGHPLGSLHREIDRLFDDVFRGFGAPALRGVDRGLAWPQVELGESDRAIHVTVELPGLEEQDVDIRVEEGVLTIRGEKKSAVADEDRGYSERSYGFFERRFSLPRDIQRDEATATFKNGVLTVTLPRSEAANENVRRIPVNGKAA